MSRVREKIESARRHVEESERVSAYEQEHRELRAAVRDVIEVCDTLISEHERGD
jgi:hypothetical protein